MPIHKPDFPKGSLGLRADRDGNLWLGNMYQAAIVKFDPRTEQFRPGRCRRSTTSTRRR